MGEGRAGDRVAVERVELLAGDRLGGDDALLLRLVGERRAGREIADRVDAVH